MTRMINTDEIVTALVAERDKLNAGASVHELVHDPTGGITVFKAIPRGAWCFSFEPFWPDYDFEARIIAHWRRCIRDAFLVPSDRLKKHRVPFCPELRCIRELSPSRS
jgi:hypothetical protein